jgi:hypothetical protein
MVLNATFNNISAIVWWSVLLVEETTYMPQITDKLYTGNFHKDSGIFLYSIVQTFH